MRFQDLSKAGMQKARDTYTGEGYLDYAWYDAVFEDAVTVGELLGITIDTEERLGHAISFSGFCSQGDGASFAGEYHIAHEACAKITKYAPLDTELLRIAQQLTALQIARRVIGLKPFSATITRSGYYSHARAMDVEIHSGEDEDPVAEAVTQLMRDFADWIYKQLEAEYDWLHSPERVDDALEDKEFDEDGVEV